MPRHIAADTSTHWGPIFSGVFTQLRSHSPKTNLSSHFQCGFRLSFIVIFKLNEILGICAASGARRLFEGGAY